MSFIIVTTVLGWLFVDSFDGVLAIGVVLGIAGAGNSGTVLALLFAPSTSTSSARGGQLIVADPRRTPMARAAQLHLQLKSGTDAALANGLLHVAIQRKLVDLDLIAESTAGFERVRRAVATYWPDRVERVTGVPARHIEEAAVILGEAATAVIPSGRGTEQ